MKNMKKETIALGYDDEPDFVIEKLKYHLQKFGIIMEINSDGHCEISQNEKFVIIDTKIYDKLIRDSIELELLTQSTDDDYYEEI